MKKFLNDAITFRDEALTGFVRMHKDIVELCESGRYLIRAHPNRKKVALISGGGSGHEPLHIGFVGKGMLDAACPGEIFTSPTPDQVAAAASAIGGRNGVLFIVKNYAGDIMNFEMGRELYDGPASMIIIDDDIATSNNTRSQGRRGVAGTVIVEKIVGAAAERGASLAALKELGQRVAGSTRSLGVALSSCTVPALGRPTFTLALDEIEMGVGIHGEAGRRRMKLASGRELADEMMATITDALARQGRTRGPAILLVNGFGGTPASELYLMAEMASSAMARHGYVLARGLVGNYATSLDMAGCSLTVSVVNDDLLELWDAPVYTAAMRWGCA